MANSRIPGILTAVGQWIWFRTPGSLGHNDHGDPNVCTLVGDTPGSLGFQDLGDPSLHTFLENDRLCCESIGRSHDGSPLILAANGVPPAGAVATAGLITKDQLKKVFPAAKNDHLQKVADELNTDLAKYGLDTVLRRAHFFAQARQEAGAGLEAKVENLNYSPEGLKKIFKYYRQHPTEADTDGYERDPKTRKITRRANQEAIANNVYANRIGNGNTQSGDGWKFRGRGLIQVTGRSNYAQTTREYRKLYAGKEIDFEKNPEKMSEFPYSVRSAVCFWIQHGLEKLADRGSTNADVDRITAKVNPATKSKNERQANFKVAYNAFK